MNKYNIGDHVICPKGEKMIIQSIVFTDGVILYNGYRASELTEVSVQEVKVDRNSEEYIKLYNLVERLFVTVSNLYPGVIERGTLLEDLGYIERSTLLDDLRELM